MAPPIRQEERSDSPLLVFLPGTDPRSGRPLGVAVWWNSQHHELRVARNSGDVSGGHDHFNLVVPHVWWRPRELVVAEAEPEEEPADLVAGLDQVLPQGLQSCPSVRQVVVAYLGPELDRGQLRSPCWEGLEDRDQLLKTRRIEMKKKRKKKPT